jgi:peptidoglycan L-alanyl-D-glutamate endopeptidase CwlK
MKKFSEASERKLQTCDVKLQRLMNAVLQRQDIIIICGHRTEKEQNEAFKNGFSKLKFPKSKHNQYPSQAVDIAPYPLNWNDINGFNKLAVIVKEEAAKLKTNIEWGGDWKSFKDLSLIHI